MKGFGTLVAVLGASALFATASLAADPASAQPAAAPAQAAAADAAHAAPAHAPRGQAPRRVFRQVGTGAVITPDPGAASKKWKDCTYNDKGAVTNAPCTGVKKDDKGVTWWP